jgi:ribosomal protein L22
VSAEDENVAGETREEPAAPETQAEPKAAKPARKKAAKPAKAKEAATTAKADKDDGESETPKKPVAKKASAKKAPAAKKQDAEKETGKEAKQETKAAERPRAGKAATKAPRRRVVRAHARYVRTSARKARMVSGHLAGKTVGEARAILAFTPREVARDWSKLLDSAVANAENNHELLEDDLVVREAYADEGPTIKRFRPRAMGRATPIHKRTSHLTITLTPGS